MPLTVYQVLAGLTEGVRSAANRACVEINVRMRDLAGETGELVSEYKKHLRDGEAHLPLARPAADEMGNLLGT